MVARHALIALLAATAAAGCRAAGGGRVAGPELPAPRATATARQVADQHNRNAQAIRSLIARPEITVQGRRFLGGSAAGNLALERPHNFRLQLRGPGNTEVAD